MLKKRVPAFAVIRAAENFNLALSRPGLAIQGNIW